MRVPLEWLREYCDPPLDVGGIEERLTMTGTKVEAIHHHGVPDPDGFVLGRVLSVSGHPDADRLSVCEVDLGPGREGGPVTIVCGAPNVAAGQVVAVAQPGAQMPDGTRLRRAKLRGVESEGMILAEDELELGADHAGIMDLTGVAARAGVEVGAALEALFPLGSDVIELEVTPNRPDCLAVYGVARELHAATGAPLAPAPWRTDPGSPGRLEGAEVEVLCPDLCPRFTARVFREVQIGPSPLWLKARLMAAGQRPINNVVDITNYVMLLTGQPLHAFDLKRVAGAHLTVRRAEPGERVETLDGTVRTLDDQMVLIADREGPTSIAGLMGGARSEVGPQTTSVLLEVANWDGPNIHRTAWALALRSEASARFEKGLAPESCDYAQALASTLMIELCGASLAPGMLDLRSPAAAGRASEPIRLRADRVRRILGIEVARERQVTILEALDFGVTASGEDLEVLVPPLRREDVTREADLIEEIARIAGLEELPATLPRRRGAYGLLSPEQRLRRRAVDLLVGLGLFEIMGWTFTSREALGELHLDESDPRADPVELANPLSEDQALLRTMLLGSLCAAAAHNAARDRSDFGIFEVGTVFGHDEAAASGTGVGERRMLGALLAGRALPAGWRSGDTPQADYFAMKGVLDALGEALGVRLAFRPAPSGAHPFLHPGRAAEIFASGAGMAEGDDGATAAGEACGWVGELHPLVLGGDLAGSPAMELDLERLVRLGAGVARTYRPIPVHPSLLRDLAVSLPQEISSEAVELAIREAAGAGGLLEGVRVFDVYTGEQVGEGRRSLALSLSFRAAERTLSEEDVAPAWEKILQRLRELGGELRA